MEVKTICQKGEYGKNINFYRMWGKGERAVSYPSTKTITHRNALVDLKKSHFILDTEREAKFRQQEMVFDDVRGHAISLSWVMFGSNFT